MKQAKIKNLNRVRINGELYEWNDFTQSYWSVLGKARELQKEDVADVDLESLELGKFEDKE
jgi:hypothetical protein